MRILLIILLLAVSFATSATTTSAHRRSNGLLHFMALDQQGRDTALASLIGKRCQRYLPEPDMRRCRDTVKKMLVLMDYDVIFGEKLKHHKTSEWTPKSFVFIAFKSNLISLLNLTKTTLYLNELNQDLYRYLSGEKTQMNIWASTKKYFETDAMTAMAMAAFYQDTSLMKLHLAYLDQSGEDGPVHFQSNKILLSRVIDTINLILDSSEDHYRQLFYPPDIQRSLNRNIYHFYVPLYLSLALTATNVNRLDAFRAALMLTLTYEFITSTEDYRYLFEDPEKITLESKLKDIFGGYCGSIIGIGRSDYKNFDDIRKAFAKSSAAGVNMLLWFLQTFG
jgi:hypothetical protein